MTSRISCVKADITKMEVDAIVNAANSSLLGGGGVDGAIHRAGGAAILEECIAIRNRQGGCSVGDAVITTGGKLPARYVIHTVGPVWQGGGKGEPELLASCYTKSLVLAVSKSIGTLAFPCISTGIYGYPKQEAATVAVQAVRTFLQDSSVSLNVVFTCFDDESLAIYRSLI